MAEGITKIKSEADDTLTPWVPAHRLKTYDLAEVKYSRGFLQSRPEKWFPGFSSYWLPLAHSLGIELQLIEVKPTLIIPGSLEYGYGARLDGEPLAICFDQKSYQLIVDSIAPGAQKVAQGVIAEYIVRRFIASATQSWSGAENSSVQFDLKLDPFTVSSIGAVKLTIMANNNYCSFWALLGAQLVDRLDGLWRRQVHAQLRSEPKHGLVQFEIGHLSIQPNLITEFVKSGAIIDLEVPLSDQIVMRLDGSSWLQARIGLSDQDFIFEVLSESIDQHESNGTTNISVIFGSSLLDAQTISELSQPGACIHSQIKASNRVSLVVQDNIIASGALAEMGGRWAVVVD